MKTYVNNVFFKFYLVCDSCKQEQYDNEEEINEKYQNLTMNDILNDGQPLCLNCDCQIVPENNVNIKA